MGLMSLLGFFKMEDPSKEVESATYDNGVMKVKYKDKLWVDYQGSGTVWHELPLMRRCPTTLEMGLADIFTYIKKWGNPYPSAHIKTPV